MPAEDDIALDEKRVYAETREETVAWVASSLGVTRVSVAGDQIGRFRQAHSCDARDLVADDGRLYVATSEEVLVGTVSGFEPSDFGPSVAVGIHEGTPLAASPDGAIAALEGNDWVERGRVPSDVRGIDGGLVAAADGVYHVEGAVSHAGLDDAQDVADPVGRGGGDSGAGAYAATGGGLYHRQDGWNEILSGEATVVTAGDGHAHAVVEGRFRERDGAHTWPPVDLPVDGTVVDVAYGEQPLAVTGDGTLLVAAGGDGRSGGDVGWRHRSLGVGEATALAIA